MTALTWVDIHCPYCGEPFTTALDGSGGERQQYTEDCQICCQPILFSLRFDSDGRVLELGVREENL